VTVKPQPNQYKQNYRRANMATRVHEHLYRPVFMRRFNRLYVLGLILNCYLCKL